MNNFQLKVIQRAIDNLHKLSSWECDFLDSLSDKSEDYILTIKQNHVLNTISEKV